MEKLNITFVYNNELQTIIVSALKSEENIIIKKLKELYQFEEVKYIEWK